jgi:UDP-N-acetylglucosamine 2-epimerase (non-hydrolysing)
VKIVTVFGTRPEWTKLSPLLPLLSRSFRHVTVHTGQHYDPALDRVIRRDLGLARPDHRLGRGKPGFAHQLSHMLAGLERILRRENPGLVLVQGDTNSTLAGALASARLGIPVAHVEAGCRSGNLAAPEEQNRRLVDSIASLHFAADETALENLRREGHPRARLVGSTGVDAVLRSASRCRDEFLRKHGVKAGAFALATLHRAENTSTRHALETRLRAIARAAENGTVILAAHPRTAAALRRFGVRVPPGLRITPPLGYLEFLSLLRRCRFVLTDSGGIQEEAAVLGPPCVVLRDETEWTRLVEAGRNFLLPELDARGARLLERLWRDDTFLAALRKRPAPGLRAGAAGRIARALRAWRGSKP